jgi:branched-chain amino acid transport system substrate-binding protein
MKKVGIAGLTVAIALGLIGGLGLLDKPALAQKRDFILVGHPNPSTGPIAAFGEASPWADELAIEEINKQGGIFIKEAGKKLPLKLKLVDTASDPTKAADVASKLILNDKVDIMVAPIHLIPSILYQYANGTRCLIARRTRSRGWKVDRIGGPSTRSGQ